MLQRKEKAMTTASATMMIQDGLKYQDWVRGWGWPFHPSMYKNEDSQNSRKCCWATRTNLKSKSEIMMRRIGACGCVVVENGGKLQAPVRCILFASVEYDLSHIHGPWRKCWREESRIQYNQLWMFDISAKPLEWEKRSRWSHRGTLSDQNRLVVTRVCIVA